MEHKTPTTKYQKENSNGFTIIELMVAVALFSIVMVLGTGAVLNASFVHKKTQAQETVLDNLNFAMEDMARNMRVGTGFRCPTDVVANFDIPLDCTNTSNNYLSVSFKGMDYKTGDITKNRVVYKFVQRTITSGTDIYNTIVQLGLDPNQIYSLKKAVDGGTTFLDMTPASVYINMARSGFNVYNATIVGDGVQPYVEIRLSGFIIYKGSSTPFSLETLISQRQLDAIGPSV